MKFEAIRAHLKSKGFDLETIENSTPQGVVVPADRIQLLAELLHRDPELYFDMLSCITGVDNGPEANLMEVIYSFYSIPLEHHLQVKVVLDRQQPKVDTLSILYKSADWYEREIFDLLGIEFIGHPDLRRILLPADWEGHPLRKDYEHQEYYRGIKVEY